MARHVHATGQIERRNMRRAAEHRSNKEKTANWAVIDHSGFEVIQEGFTSREKAEEWLENVPRDSRLRPEWLTDQETDIRIARIGWQD